MVQRTKPQQYPAHRIRTMKNEARALELRKGGASFSAVAETVRDDEGERPYSNATAARRAVVRAMQRLGKEDADELRALMVLQLEDWERRTLEIFLHPHPVLYKGEPVVIDGRRVDDDGPKLQALDRFLRVQESLRRLLGLDAAQKFEHTGEDGQPIEVDVNWAEQLLGRVETLREGGQLRALPADGEAAE